MPQHHEAIQDNIGGPNEPLIQFDIDTIEAEVEEGRCDGDCMHLVNKVIITAIDECIVDYGDEYVLRECHHEETLDYFWPGGYRIPFWPLF